MPADIVDQAIKDAFTCLDHIIIDGGAEAAVGDRFLNDAMSELSPSYSGSCALVSNCLSLLLLERFKQLETFFVKIGHNYAMSFNGLTPLSYADG